jgi:hypothetical protein
MVSARCGWRSSATSFSSTIRQTPPARESINCYLVEGADFTTAAFDTDGKKFRFVPQRLLYPLQWKHNGTPPDLHLQLVSDPQQWFDMVSLTPLAELTRHDPQLRDRLRAATAP